MVIVKEREFQLSLRRVLIVVGRVLIVVDHLTYRVSVMMGLARRSGPFRNLHLAPPSNLNKQQNRICGSGYRAFFLLAIVRLNR